MPPRKLPMKKRVWSYVRKHPAFTLIEMTMTIALFGAISAMVIPLYSNFRLQSELYDAVELTAQGIGRAKVLSQSGEGDSPSWGFHTPSGILYEGTSYAARDPAADESYALPPTVAVTGLLDVSFTNGIPNTVGTIMLTSIGGNSIPVEIEINEEGIVANKSDKFTICHYPPGQPSNPQTLTISQNAWPAHKKHCADSGECDFIGACGELIAGTTGGDTGSTGGSGDSGGGPGPGGAPIANGAPAVDLLGKYDDSLTDPVPVYTKGNGTWGINDGPNKLGFTRPGAVLLDGTNHRLFIADTENHRVLVYTLNADNSFPDLIPDFVLGQPNFYTRSSAATQSSLSFPYSLAYDSGGNRLFVGDSGNHRILIFSLAGGITNGMAAANVLGKMNFTTSTIPASPTQSTFQGPLGLAYDSAGNRLFVSSGVYDTLSTENRVLIFDVASIINGENAVNVLGQLNFTSSTAATTQAGMRRPMALAYDSTGNRLVVVDNINNRVLLYDVASISNGENAVNVLGQSRFDRSNAGLSSGGLERPGAATYHQATKRLFVADGAPRVMVYDLTAISNGENAVNVLGQSAFNTGTPAVTQAGLTGVTGVWHDSTSNKLFTVDSSVNRVLVYDVAAISNGENAVSALGQFSGPLTAPVPHYTKGYTVVYDDPSNPSTGSVRYSWNNGPNALGLYYTRGIALDTVNHRLFVVDVGNNRVLVYNLTAGNALVDHTPDAVLGQSDFFSNAATTTQAKMMTPDNLAYDSAGNRLFVSDRTSNRVLVFDVASISNGENAVNVLGQLNFTSSTAATTQAGMREPTGLAYDSGTSRLFVVDRTNNRVLVYDVASISNGENAVNVLGQPNFTSSAQATTQAGMKLPRGAFYDSTSNRLFVGDHANHRVLVYDVAAISNGENAVNVLGQPNFTSSAQVTTQAGMSGPIGLFYDSTANRLFVGESGNHRVLIFDLTGGITDGMNASNVLGQPDFTSGAGGTSQAGFYTVWSVAYDSSSGLLFVSDNFNSRIMIFDLIP